MKKSILSELPILVQDGVISEEIAKSIRNYYLSKEPSSISRLYLVFGILGALSIGLGLILIIAHNWDDFSRSSKTIFSFFPLLLGQILGGFTLLKRSSSQVWRETSSIIIFFSVGASMALISQIYNMGGDFNVFMLTWMMLSLPLVYILQSSVTSLFYLIGLTYYVCNTQYWSYSPEDSYLFWFLYALILPHYYILWKRKMGNFLTLHHYFIPLALTIVLGTATSHYTEFMFFNYISLFSLFFIMGSHPQLAQKNILRNGYIIIGSIGLIALSMAISFNWFWKELFANNYVFTELIFSPEILVSTILVLAIALTLYQNKAKSIREYNPLAFTFILAYLLFLIGSVSSNLPQILVNIFVLLCGLKYIKEGNSQGNLGLLNLGLFVISILIICRFFDLNVSYVIRGILFVLVGTGFFIINFYMFKKKNASASKDSSDVILSK